MGELRQRIMLPLNEQAHFVMVPSLSSALPLRARRLCGSNGPEILHRSASLLVFEKQITKGNRGHHILGLFSVLLRASVTP